MKTSIRKRNLKSPHDGDRDLFFSKIPWMFENNKGELLRIEDGNGNLMALVMFDDHSPALMDGQSMKKGGNVFLSVASFSKAWFCSPDIFWCVFSYPFVQLGCDRVTTITPSFNRKALRINKASGFSIEGVLRQFYAVNNGIYDAIIMGITRDEVKMRGYV